jgi:outer membrane receptor protein involved in Fe transport
VVGRAAGTDRVARATFTSTTPRHGQASGRGVLFDEKVFADQRFDQASNGTDIDSRLDTESLAIFGEATLTLTDRWRVTGGLRYTRDNKTQDTETHTRPFVGFVPPVRARSSMQPSPPVS